MRFRAAEPNVCGFRPSRAGELQWEFRTDEREIGEPLKFAYLFAEKSTGQPVASVAYVNSKDVETAKQLLAEITFAEAAAFLDFALAEAAKTNFNVQTLGGIRQYLAKFKAKQGTMFAARERETVRRQDENQRIGYDRYRRWHGRIFASGWKSSKGGGLDVLEPQ